MTAPRLTMPDALVEDEARRQLEHVYDPELGVNVLDLGLVYELEARSGQVRVVMTLTTPGCPMSDSMPDAVERALRLIPGVAEVSVDLVWDPPWDPDMMSERARRELGLT